MTWRWGYRQSLQCSPMPLYPEYSSVFCDQSSTSNLPVMCTVDGEVCGYLWTLYLKEELQQGVARTHKLQTRLTVIFPKSQVWDASNVLRMYSVFCHWSPLIPKGAGDAEALSSCACSLSSWACSLKLHLGMWPVWSGGDPGGTWICRSSFYWQINKFGLTESWSPFTLEVPFKIPSTFWI